MVSGMTWTLTVSATVPRVFVAMTRYVPGVLPAW